MPLTLEPPEITREEITDDSGADLNSFGLKIFNNETTSFDEVIWALMLATGCPQTEAKLEANEAHMRGWAFVHWATKTECEKAAAIIEKVGVDTEIVEV